MANIKTFLSKDLEIKLLYTAMLLLLLLGIFVFLTIIRDPAKVILCIVAINGLVVSAFFFRRYGFFFPLAVLMVSSLLNRYEISVGSYTVRPEHIIGVMVFLLLVLFRLLKRRKIAGIDWPMLLVISWVLVNGIASQLNAPNPHESYKQVFRMAILAMIYLTVANGFSHTRPEWLAGLKLWLKLGLLEALYGVVVWIAASVGNLHIGVRTTPRLSFLSLYGTLLERDIFGSFTASIFVMLLFILLKQKRLKRRILFKNTVLLLGLLISGTALLLSYVRAAWIATFLVSTLAYLRIDNRFRAHLARLLAVGVVIILAVVPITLLIAASPADWSFVNRLRTFSNLGQDPTWQPRLEENLLAIKDWSKHPFIGNGTGSFAQIHGLVRGQPAWIGNLFLHTMVDTGLFGLLIQVLLFGRILHEAMGLSKGTPSLEVATGLSALFWGMLVLLVAYQATDATWFAAFWIHLGLMKSGTRLTTKAMGELTLPGRSPSVNPNSTLSSALTSSIEKISS
jgi:hypothetical protein